MNHKRKRAKHRRAGCLTCKSWKSKRTVSDGIPGIGRLGTHKFTAGERRRLQVGRDER